MTRSIRSRFSRKGITPIIATVLLLGITVAIGLTVYTQAQGMIGNTDTSNINRLQETDVSLTPVFDNDGEMQVQVSNKGDRAINVSDFTVYYGPPNYDPVSYSVLEAQASDWTVGNDGNQCFTSNMSSGADSMDNDILEQGERASCSTGVKFPGALESVEIRVEADDFEYSQSTLCSVDSEDANSCS